MRKTKPKLFKSLFRLYVILVTYSLNAQEVKSECDKNIKLAHILLNGSNTISKNPEGAISLIEKCVEDGSIKAQYLLGMLYKKGIGVPVDHKMAYKYIEKAAQSGHPGAACELGILYKDGTGCKLDFNKAINWFVSAYELGNQKASYSLGYMHFKGLGSVGQNYAKAIEWFKKSEFPMAKHFLGICNYFGYGTSINKQKALELLLTNETITNSEKLAHFLEENINTSISNHTKKNNDSAFKPILKKGSKISNIDESNNLATLSKKDLIGDWKGKIIELDWSRSKILRNINTTLSFSKNKDLDELNYHIDIEGQTSENYGIFIEDSFYLNKLNISLPRIYLDDNIKSKLNYDLLSISDINIKEIDHVYYLVANIESKVLDWNEPGPPMKLILKDTKVSTDNGKEIDEDFLNELAKIQDNSFITLYPNPFKTDLLVQYDLTEESLTSVEIFSFGGSFVKKIVDKKIQKSGNHLYHIDGTEFRQQGLYVVKVIVNDKVYTKLIVKE